MNKLPRVQFLFQVFRFLPKKYPVQYDGLQQPFFVIGSGRNGSTLLNRMLNANSQLYLPSEQYFLGPSVFKYHYYNYALWRDLVKVIAGELITSGGSHTWQVSELPDFRELYLLPREKKRLQYLLDVMYRFPAGKDFKIWGDTTPLNSYYLSQIYDTFPRARYCFLVRDGRDVIASYKTGGKAVLGDLAEPVRAAHHWMHAVEQYDWLRKRTEVKLIRYESLVAEPERVLTEVCEYLKVPFEAQMLNFYEQIPDRKMYDLPVHQNLKKPVFESSIGKYEEALTADELRQIMPVIDKGLRKLGYI